jgi:heptosyltransferase-1
MSRHAIERLRELAGKALGFRCEGPPVFALSPPAEAVPSLPDTPYALLLHATSRAEKQWPQARWRELIVRLAGVGLTSALPWGSPAEHERALALAGGLSAACSSPGTARCEGTAAAPVDRAAGAIRRPALAPVVLPRLTLRQCAAAFARAQLVVGVDTGLTHLAAALDAPTVALFAATPAWRFGPYWTPRAANLGEEGRWPDVEDVMAAAGRVRSVPQAPAVPDGRDG